MLLNIKLLNILKLIYKFLKSEEMRNIMKLIITDIEDFNITINGKPVSKKYKVYGGNRFLCIVF